MRMTLSQVAAAVGARLPSGALERLSVTGLCTNTRAVVQGDLFLALIGERYDGHDFVAEALAKGAVAAVVCRQPSGVDPQVVLTVPDTLAALGLIAREWRRRFAVPVVAVTGSVGKTSTKDMLACALSTLGPVDRTDRNENNEIGLPKTLLRLTSEHRAVVVEMGMRGAGQIRGLAEIAEPTIGIITLIGESHIELLGSRAAIAAAKCELFEQVAKSGGTAIYNAGDDFAQMLGDSAGEQTITFVDADRHPNLGADFRLLAPRRDGSGWAAEAIGPGGAGFALSIASPARHDLVNALGAVAAAHAAGISPKDAARQLRHYRPGAMRMEIVETPSGARVLSDCYNAAPTSMRAALETLASTDATGRRIAFLGDMKELGPHAANMHEAVARRARELGLTEIYVVGEDFGRSAEHARQRFASARDAARFARDELGVAEGDLILVKGSRSMMMEAVVEALTAAEAPHSP